MADHTVLIVDDEPTNIKLIKAFLMREGYQLLTALSGEEALTLAEETVPDLVLLDVMMPGLDGFEVCERLKQKQAFKDVPVIMVTALKEREHKVKAMNVGADDFICKPLDGTELLVRVKSLLRIKSYRDDLMKSYQEISQKNEKLRELEKVKESLTHMIIHDLNNSFMVISGNLQLMELEVDASQASMKNYLKRCTMATDDVEDMVRGLLDIHKMEEGKLILENKEIDLDALIKATLESLDQIAKQNKIDLKFLKKADQTRISGDWGILKRVIGNLLNNAFRHTPDGGSVEVEISPARENRSICLSVKDTGDGLPQEYHEKIFEKFEQVNLKNAGIRKGSAGLGLSFCKMAIEAHQGKIWVESDGEGKGCTFRIALPV